MALKLELVVLPTVVAFVLGRTIELERLALSLTEESGETDTTSQIIQAFLDTSLAVDELSDLSYCKNGKCKACAKKLVTVCFEAALGKSAIKLSVTINGRSFISTNITVPNPPPICKKTVPFIPSISDVCVRVKDVDLTKGAGCVYISLKVKIGRVKKNLSFKVDCFRIKSSIDDVSDQGEHKIDDVSNQNETEAVIIKTQEEDSTGEDVTEMTGAQSTLFFQSLA